MASSASGAKPDVVRADHNMLPYPSESQRYGAMGPSLAAAGATSIAGASLMRQLGLVSLHSDSRVPPASGPVIGVFRLSRAPDPSLAALHLTLDAAGSLFSLTCIHAGVVVCRPRPTGRGTIARPTTAGDGERCLGRNIRRGEDRSPDAALLRRSPMVCAEGGTFLSLVTIG